MIKFILPLLFSLSAFAQVDRTLDATNIRLKEPSPGANVITLKAPTSFASDFNFIFPTTVGTSGQVLTAGTAGTLSWQTPAATGVTGIYAGSNLIADPSPITGVGTISVGTLGVSQGGTGKSTVAAAGNFLISNGTGYIDGTIAAGSNVTVTNVAGTYTIAASSSGNPVIATTGTSYVASTEDIIITTGSLTVSLPAVGSKVIKIQKGDFALANKATITPMAGDVFTTSGSTGTSLFLHTYLESVTLTPAGTTWYVSRHIPPLFIPASVAGTVNLSSTGTPPTKWTTRTDEVELTRLGKYAIIDYLLAASSATGAAVGTGDYTIGLPLSLEADTTLTGTTTAAYSSSLLSTKNILINAINFRSDSYVIPGDARMYDSTKFRLNTTSSAWWGSGGNGFTNSNPHYIRISVKIPIKEWAGE